MKNWLKAKTTTITIRKAKTHTTAKGNRHGLTMLKAINMTTLTLSRE